MRIFLCISIFLFSFCLKAQKIESLDTSKIISINSNFKQDESIKVFRYLFGRSLQNKSSYLKFGERFLYSTYFVWIPSRGYYKGRWLHEFTWYNSLSINLNKSIYFGLHYLLIFTTGSTIYQDSKRKKYGVYGLVMQYDFLPGFENRLYLETSINKGDICLCGFDDPRKSPDLTYLGLGLGYDFPVYKRITLRVGFTNYVIFNNIKDKSNFTQYVLGINLNIGKNSKRQSIKFDKLFK